MIYGFFNQILGQIETNSGFVLGFVMVFSTWKFIMVPRGIVT